jgi:hypothetical protein
LSLALHVTSPLGPFGVAWTSLRTGGEVPEGVFVAVAAGVRFRVTSEVGGDGGKVIVVVGGVGREGVVESTVLATSRQPRSLPDATRHLGPQLDLIHPGGLLEPAEGSPTCQYMTIGLVPVISGAEVTFEVSGVFSLHRLHSLAGAPGHACVTILTQ